MALLRDLRYDHTRLGYAIKHCTLCYVGTFLTDPTDVPAMVVRTLCDQPNLKDPSVFPRYLQCLSTTYEHQQQIRKALGYIAFEGEAVTDGEALEVAYA